jgi:hypothetical protein
MCDQGPVRLGAAPITCEACSSGRKQSRSLGACCTIRIITACIVFEGFSFLPTPQPPQPAGSSLTVKMQAFLCCMMLMCLFARVDACA